MKKIEKSRDLWYALNKERSDRIVYDGAMQTAFKQLSPEQQTAVYHYVLFLINNPSIEVTIHKEEHPKRKLGLLSERFRGISEDF